MLKEIKIFNRFYMDRCAKTGGLNFPYKDKRWNLISIYDFDNEYVTPQVKSILSELGCRDFLSLDFWDLTDDIITKVRKKYPEAILFTEKQARQVVDFLDVIQKDEEDSILVAHCAAGISRSGAIGTFACDYCGLDYNEFIGSNSNIMANPHVLRVLSKVAGMTPSFEDHDGIAPIKEGTILVPPWVTLKGK